ncbi:SdiA-regulated domain-containing protein [Marinicella litoralis]|uniref:SdiA-regulated protein n=1 Tax=Marinicella litoralis TaxID=644220 RepID=A0A4R6XLI4_9GAMM|nr:SdiA-regulated domain-containing protein [Marinicella litoralis]TDR18447.1 SdiA-regulated protein [Marinicella litoralis]
MKKVCLPVMYQLFLTALLIHVGYSSLATEVNKLNDFQVYSIQSSYPIEPSGLTLKEGQLFTVCDDANVIFKLNFLSGSIVEAEEHEKLDVTQIAALALDLEGITMVDNDFFVASETHHKLVSVKEGQLKWVPDFGGVYADAFKAGLFQIYNAGIESVVYLGNQTFLLSVERQPRGLIEVQFDESFSQIVKQTNQVFDDSAHSLESDRKPDLTGLFLHNGVIYAIHRNAYIIHELLKDEKGLYREGQSWSYEHIVKHPDNAFQDMQFGHAEGLAVDDDNFYLIFDNNKNPKLKNPNDIRPLLVIAKRK